MLFYGCDTKKFRTSDSIKLIEYAFSNFEYLDIQKLIDTKINEWNLNNTNYFEISKGSKNSLSLSSPILETPKIPIKKDEINSLNVFINTNKFLSAPIKESDIIGTLTVLSANDVLLSTNLTANTTINKKTLKDYLNIFVKNYSIILDHSCNFIN